MKTLLAFLLTCVVALGQALPAHRAIATPTPASGESPTYLIQEGFENTGSPGYDDGTWTEAGGSPPNENYTGANLLDGSESLNCVTTSASASTYRAYTLAQADQYFFFKVRYVSGSGEFIIAQVLDSSGNSLGFIKKENDDTYSCQANGDGTDRTTVSTFTDGTPLYVWVQFTQGSGANATLKIWCSTTGTKPADGSNGTATSSTGTTTAQGARWRFGWTAGVTADFVFDSFKMDDVPIGDQ